ncbi:unnamed protein product, partial [marine sediment metagenome]
ETLKKIFGKEAEKVKVIRLVLFNPIDQRDFEDKRYIRYSLPIRLAVARVSGKGDIKNVIDIFRKSGFKVTELSSQDAKNLEFSKLFLNLIGMASASRGVSIKEGFRDKEIFKEEVDALKEYIKAVKSAGGKFLNFPYYPVKFLAVLIDSLPFSFLSFSKNVLAKIISKGRGKKPKALDEIEYYNGAVVKLGKKAKVKTPANGMIYKRGLKRLEIS